MFILILMCNSNSNVLNLFPYSEKIRNKIKVVDKLLSDKSFRECGFESEMRKKKRRQKMT